MKMSQFSGVIQSRRICDCCESPSGKKRRKERRPNPFAQDFNPRFTVLKGEVGSNIHEKYVLGRELGRGEFSITFFMHDNSSLVKHHLTLSIGRPRGDTRRLHVEGWSFKFQKYIGRRRVSNLGSQTMSGENGVVALLENGDSKKSSSYAVKVGLAQMLRGGVILDVGSVQEARIAEEAGAIAVMAVESIGQRAGVNRMSDPGIIREIKKSVNIPVISRVRIGHFVEGQILEAIGVDFIDERDVLTSADDRNFIDKHNFHSPYVCGCRTLGEGLRRIAEGVAMLRTEENANQTGDVMMA